MANKATDAAKKFKAPTAADLAAAFAPPSKEDMDEAPTDYAGAAQAGLMQLGRSTTFGLGDRIGAGVDVLTDKLTPKSFLDRELEAQGFKIEQPELTYEQALQSRKALEEQQKEEHPWATTAGEIGGYLVGGSGVGKLATKGLSKVAPRLVEKAAEKGLGALAARAAVQGVEGAAQGAAYGVAPQLEGTSTIGEEAKMGGMIGAAFPVAGAALRVAGKAPIKAIRTFLGPSEEVVQKYLARPDAIKNAPSMEKAIGIFDEAVGKIKGEFEAAKISREEAEDAFKTLKDEIKATHGTAKADAKEALNRAKQGLDNAFAAEKEMLRKTPAPIHMVDEVLDANRQIKNKLIEESQNATALLTAADAAKKPVKIARDPVLKMLKENIKALENSVSEVDHASAKELKGYIQRFESKPALLSMEESKGILKQLDNDIEYNYDSGAFNSTKDRVLKQIRGAINDTIGEKVPQYKAYMEAKVQPLAELRSEASRMYGNPDKVRSKLMRLHNPELQAERDVLQKMGQVAGKDFESPLQAYQSAQKTLKSPLAQEAIKQGLPEAQQVAKAQAEVSQLGRVTGKDLEAQARASQEYGMLQAAKDAEAGKKEVFESIKAFDGATTEAKIKSLMGSKDNVRLRAKMAQLSALTGIDFAQVIDDMRTKAAFDSTFMNGSRNVNLWGALGALGNMVKSPQAIGSGTAGTIIGGPVGGMIGVIFGGIVDRYGPKMAQGVLDGYLAIKGIPTVQKIGKAFNSLDPALKSELVNDFRRMIVTGITQHEMEVPDAAVPHMRAEIQNSNLPPNVKAKMISELNRTGRLIHADKLLLGTEPPPAPGPSVQEVKRGQPPAVKDLTSQIQGRRNPAF